jgi:acyl carrier protein
MAGPTIAALEEQVIEIITRKKNFEPGRVTAESAFADLGIDSLDGMDLLFDFEDRYNINIPDEVARQMKSVRDVIESLHAALNKPSPQPAEPS